MIQFIKRYYYSFMYCPSFIPGFSCLFIARYLYHEEYFYSELIFCFIAFLFALWPCVFEKKLGNNFKVLPALPFCYKLVGQRKVKDAKKKSDDEILNTIKEDEKNIDSILKPGKYMATTHSVIIARLKRSSRVEIKYIKPVYLSTLSSVHKVQTGRNSDKLGGKYLLYNASPRQFYLIKFVVR